MEGAKQRDREKSLETEILVEKEMAGKEQLLLSIIFELIVIDGSLGGCLPIILVLECGGPLLLSVVLHHLVFVTAVLLDHDFHPSLREGGLRLNDIVIVAVGAELVSLLELTHLFAEGLLALLAKEDQIEGGHELVVIAEHLFVAVGAVEPLLAAGGANRHLGVHNVFAHTFYLNFVFAN